ncbi:LPXTG cell wall anchor domain-containing protein [Streptomyces ficellus]|uniref:LPXTG cell wall anchor domain-containing protein n=1 Tax=Streptomyces ficellus TaxID=1977088 RepID=A0ABT7ZD82_9ACTN|nr:LPXTG cell wall anchor domain-containing protein [Streptomyces ficellus]MDN3297464.1 LPXTG cell wall anchor domain-containing protein [Streptomyces ficellus]
MLATAVVAAVTTPAVLLTVTPAFADTEPAVPQGQDRPVGRALADAPPSDAPPSDAPAPDAPAPRSQPSIAELERAALEAKKAYDVAVAAEALALQAQKDVYSDAHPLAVAAATAKKAAEAAATAKDDADQKLADAEAELKKLEDSGTATDQEKADAEKKVADAAKVAEAAATAKDAADAKAKEADQARDAARDAADQRLDAARKATAAALAAKDAADKALADAKKEAEEGSCVPEDRLTVDVTGLPAKVTAGTTVDFTLRVTNGTGRTLDEVWPEVSIHATDKSGEKSLDDLLDVQWSTTASPTWQDLDADEFAGAIEKLKAGAHADVKLRLKVDASAVAGDGEAAVAADYVNEDGTCGGMPEYEEYDFDVVAAAVKPGKTTPPSTSGTQAQGATSNQPVTTTSGSLADTGSSSAMPKVALAGGAAVALGAGAMFAVRRRKAGADI